MTQSSACGCCNIINIAFTWSRASHQGCPGGASAGTSRSASLRRRRATGGKRVSFHSAGSHFAVKFGCGGRVELGRLRSTPRPSTSAALGGIKRGTNVTLCRQTDTLRESQSTRVLRVEISGACRPSHVQNAGPSSGPLGHSGWPNGLLEVHIAIWLRLAGQYS